MWKKKKLITLVIEAGTVLVSLGAGVLAGEAAKAVTLAVAGKFAITSSVAIFTLFYATSAAILIPVVYAISWAACAVYVLAEAGTETADRAIKQLDRASLSS